MDNGLYIAISRQLALLRDMDVTANNIANANTAGYNAERMMFNAYLAKDINQRIPNPMTFAHDVSTYRDTRTGPLQATGNQLDIAINGNGYFMVETPLGTRYTRAGHMQLDGNGNLITSDGHFVLDQSSQRIVLPDNVRTVEIGSLGNMKVNGDDFAAIGVFQFDNEQLLERQGNGLYKAEVTPVVAENVTVAQGVLEGSNVRPVLELTHMINVARDAAGTAKFISAIYELERKASNTWAQQG